MARYNPYDYRVTPSVVCTGVPTEITITPRGANAVFPDGYDYTIEIWGADDATTVIDPGTHWADLQKKVIKPQVGNGCLKFTFTFAVEQQYVLRVKLPEVLQYSTNPHYNPPYRSAHAPMKQEALRFPALSVYAVEPDLFGMKVFKGDLHAHTWDSDGHESDVGIIANWRKAGHDFGAITNHYWYHSYEKAMETLNDLPDVFSLFPGEEVHVPSEFIHVVAIGGKKSVNDAYYDNTEAVIAEIAELEKTLDIPDGIDKHNYASRVWIADKAREYGAISILTHPFWIWSEVYFMPLALTRLLLDRKIHDCLEFNCGGSEDSALTTSLYYDTRAKGYDVPFVGSSDTHGTDGSDPAHPSTGTTLVLAKDRSWESIRDGILSCRSAVMEQWGGENAYRLYGSFRTVKYLNFLVKAYYPEYTEISYALGSLIKDYERNPSPALRDLIAAAQKRADDFSDAFFGIVK
ncbi:MAG: hypothetical protein MJ070_01950 [Lachnospiraceae bacterium]|nr:hypothetical protein [Lachnospiraceae bacterium]